MPFYGRPRELEILDDSYGRPGGQMLNHMGNYWRAALSLCVLLLASAASPGAVSAAVQAAPASAPVTFNVNSTNDVVANFSGDPGFTVCHTSPINSTCTLRAAIMNANRHVGSATINLPPGLYVLTLAPAAPFGDANGSLDISRTVTLAGAGAAGTIVDGGALDRVFLLTSSAVVTMTGITIQHGDSVGGAAIHNLGQLFLANSVLTHNHASAEGAGLWNDGTATISRSSLVSNTSDIWGGGVSNHGSLTIEASTIADNTAYEGGAIRNDTSTLTVFDSTLSNNRALVNGGAVENFSLARFYHSTIAGNLADSQAHGVGIGGGGIYNNAILADVQLFNTLLADNYISHTLNDCVGPITSQDYDLIQTTAGCTISGTTTHNVMNIADPLLGELANNGGGTRTRALLAGSPALDRIPGAFGGPCQDEYGTAPVPDQRGVARPVGLACDIGAFEGAQPTPLFGPNLVRNGDAEASAGSPTGAWVGTPDWLLSLGQFTTVAYNATGGFPAVPTDTVPANHGANFFAGGKTASAQAAQKIDVNVAAGLIDFGQLNFVLSADLGGFGSQGDDARVIVSFLDNLSVITGPPVTLGPVSAADRSNKTGLLFRSLKGRVPAHTRRIDVVVILTRAGICLGCDNDGYVDNIYLALAPMPLFLPVVRR